MDSGDRYSKRGHQGIATWLHERAPDQRVTRVGHWVWWMTVVVGPAHVRIYVRIVIFRAAWG